VQGSQLDKEEAEKPQIWQSAVVGRAKSELLLVEDFNIDNSRSVKIPVNPPPHG